MAKKRELNLREQLGVPESDNSPKASARTIKPYSLPSFSETETAQGRSMVSGAKD
jgi:hypothetical protein